MDEPSISGNGRNLGEREGNSLPAKNAFFSSFSRLHSDFSREFDAFLAYSAVTIHICGLNCVIFNENSRVIAISIFHAVFV